MDRVSVAKSLMNVLAGKAPVRTAASSNSDATQADSPRQPEDRAQLDAETSIGRGALGDMGGLPWRKTRVPNLGEGYCAAAMAVRTFLHSPETAQAAQQLLDDPQALLKQLKRGEAVRVGELELRLSPDQIQQVEDQLANGQLDEDTLGPALLTLGVHNVIAERSGTGSANRESFHSVLGDLGLEGKIVKPGLMGAEPGDFVAYGDSVDERHLMRVMSVNSDGTFTLEDAYGVRITVTEEQFMDQTRRAGASDIGYSSAVLSTAAFTSRRR